MNDVSVAIASHELRNALTVIKACTQVLQRSLCKEQGISLDQEALERAHAKQLSYLDTIVCQTNYMDELIGQLLDVSCLRSGQLPLQYRRVDLVALVQQVVHQQSQITTDHQFMVHTSDETLFATCDETSIRQVLDNLVNNALKYSPPGTAIIVGIERHPRDVHPPEVVIWVQDEGCGISQEHHAALFDPFYRVCTKGSSCISGLGLGLYISREVINLYGGRMWLKSEPGKGSTFSFSLPLERPHEQDDESFGNESERVAVKAGGKL
jgi:two-component system, OmpR family, phosphate regulon sensor histidine kinase PhoR